MIENRNAEITRNQIAEETPISILSALESMNRREFLATSGVAAASLLVGSSANASSLSPIVNIRDGNLQGITNKGVHVFKGIPYGATTAGKNRFKPPVQPEPWSGVRDAFNYGPSAPQTGRGASSNEDCLVLNVWTPGLNDGGDRPVMVWLHGGGFRSGSGSAKTYDGTNLCNGQDVVVVTINHRLNIFSSNYLEEFAGDEFAGSGCAGILDIVQALEWVRDNIQAFGGDPSRVTIFGESGGGRKTTTLLAMPKAQGLFHRAIIQSGAILEFMPKEDGLRQASMLLDEVGISKRNAQKLQHIPVDWLQRAHAEVLKKVRPTRKIVGITTSTPVLDGTFLPADPFAPTATTLSANVPVMVGWCRTEETLFQQPTPKNLAMTDADLIEGVKDRLGSKRKMAHDVIAAYRETHPTARPWDLYTFFCTDQPRGTYPKELAIRKAALGAAPTYVYRFDWDLGNELKTPHALEIPFAFDNIDYGIGLFDIPKTEEAYRFAKNMSANWAAFARNGTPNSPDMPQWPAYTPDTRSTMILNNQSRIENDPEPQTRKIMQHVLDL